MNFKGIYSKDLFINKSLNDQKELFDVIDATFKKDKNNIPDKLTVFYKEAEKNNIAIIDYLSMLYFSNENGIESNLYFASCLALYASSNGSKLASSRIRSLLYPAYQYVMAHVDKISLYDTYNLTDENCEDFILSHISSVLIFEMKISLKEILDMHKNLSEYPEFKILDLEDLREEKLEKMVMYLGL